MNLTRLNGQLIGSIRRVRFEPAGQSEAIEIEAKSGRYLHISVDPDGDAIIVAAGPAHAKPGYTRDWEDLTAILPGAFDGRPAILDLQSGPACVLTIRMSTGARVTLRAADGALVVEGSRS